MDVIPGEVTSFVGRGRLLATTLELVTSSDARLISLIGTGGVGKTRLWQRLAAGAKASGAFGRVVLVRLADVSATDDRMESAIAEALGLGNNEATDQLALIIAYVQSTDVLLMLDNLEHLVDRVQPLVTALLKATDTLKIVTTSRRTLEVEGEHIVDVPPLCTGEAGDCDTESSDEGAVHEAVRLLIDRAAAVGVRITDEDLPQAVQLCVMLGGIPLAIELAAVRLKRNKMTLQEIVAHPSLLWLLVGGVSVSQQENHQTLRAMIQWSYSLLDEPEQEMWAAVSVFDGGFDREAAMAVCTGDVDEDGVVRLLDELVDNTVLIAESLDGRTRYRMLPIIQQFGREQADQAGRTEELRKAHAEYFAALADTSADRCLGPDEIALMGRMHTEIPNLWRAFAYFLTTPGQRSRGRLLAINAHRTRFALYWAALNSQKRMLTMAAEDSALDDPSELQLAALCMIGYNSLLQGHQSAAVPVLERAEATARQLGLQDTFGPLLDARGAWLWLAEPDVSKARACYDLFDRAAEYYRRCGCLIDAWMVTQHKAVAAAFFGDEDRAVMDSQRVLREARAVNAKWCIGLALWACSLAELRCGDAREAARMSQEALATQRATDDKSGRIWSLWSLGLIAIELGEHERGARLLGCTRQRQQVTQTSVLGLLPWLTLQQRYEGRAREALGDTVFEEAVRLGQSMSAAQAYALALESFAPPGKARRDVMPGGLSTREYEVAKWVSTGRTNKEIATILGLSTRTVDAHIQNILKKLDVGTRTMIARWYLTTEAPAEIRV